MTSLNFKTPIDGSDNQKLRERFSKHLSENLKQARNKKGWTQQELAEKAGLHLTYIGHLELGKYHPSTFTTWKIVKAMGISMDELV